MSDEPRRATIPTLEKINRVLSLRHVKKSTAFDKCSSPVFGKWTGRGAIRACGCRDRRALLSWGSDAEQEFTPGGNTARCHKETPQ